MSTDPELFNSTEPESKNGVRKKKKPTHSKTEIKVKALHKSSQSLRPGLHSFASKGSITEGTIVLHLKALENLFSEEALNPIYKNIDDWLKNIYNSFESAGWDDENTAKFIDFISALSSLKNLPEPELLKKWISAHKNDIEALSSCIYVVPPKDIRILKRYPKTGSQKWVFLAQWRHSSVPKILKTFINDSEDFAIINEMEANPLNIKHPNIIETHFLTNDAGKKFLIEEKLPEVLHDDWAANGIKNAANLMYDILNALTFIHKKGLVHRDIKPDNIGNKHGTFILIDFGICSYKSDIFPTSKPSGSLRTRAPELLLEKKYDDPAKADIWALGATIFRVLTGRFPLFHKNEVIPRGSNPEERIKMQDELSRRANSRYAEFVTMNDIRDEIFRPLLAKALAKNCADRPTAAELLKECENSLRAYLRPTDRNSMLNPLEEIDQLTKHLPKDQDLINQMPSALRHELKDHLEEIRDLPGIKDDPRIGEKITKLHQRL
jgi:serine/threonine protein kinase